MGSQLNPAVFVALEPVNVDLNLEVHERGVVPGVKGYALSSQVGGKVLGEYPGKIGVQGLGPAVLARQFEPVRCDAGDDLLPIEVRGHLDRTESNQDLAGTYAPWVRAHRREHEELRVVTPGREAARDRNRAQRQDYSVLSHWRLSPS